MNSLLNEKSEKTQMDKIMRFRDQASKERRVSKVAHNYEPSEFFSSDSISLY